METKKKFRFTEKQIKEIENRIKDYDYEEEYEELFFEIQDGNVTVEVSYKAWCDEHYWYDEHDELPGRPRENHYEYTLRRAEITDIYVYDGDADNALEDDIEFFYDEANSIDDFANGPEMEMLVY